MEKTIQYDTEEERAYIINQNSTLHLIGEKNIFENGDYTKKNNYLIFSDVKPVEMQLQEQMDNQLTIMEAIADIYSALPTTTT